MKNIFYFLMVLLVCSIPMIAQDKDDDNNEREYSYWNRTKIGGAGGVTPLVGFFDNKEVDKFLTSAGMPTLGSDPLYLIGGEGYGYIMFLKNVRMGGFGVTGRKTVSAIQPITGGGNLKKEVDYEVSYGGFLIDYVQPIAYRLDVSIGASIGGGQMNFTMRRDNGNFKDWATEWSDFGNPNSQAVNYTKHLNGTFVVFNPRVAVEYTLLTWLQLRIGAGYPIMYSPTWQLDEKYEVNAVPSKIKLNGYTVNAGIMFGFFGW
ncbi:MAG: hypothetical protein ACOYNS_02085 [Bacteroidota bacterium]